MATAKYAKLMREAGQTLFDYIAATDAGDQKVFTVPGKTIFSKKAGYEVIVRPDGVVSGRNMLTPHADADKVTIAGFTCYLAGALTTIVATTADIDRPSTDKAKIASITVNSSGVIAVVAGTDGTGTTFSETRGAAGGPPYIPVGSVEIGQVRVATSASAVIDKDEIFQTPGTHVERYNYPMWAINELGDGEEATTSAKTHAHVEFEAVVGDAIHTGDTYRKIYVRGYTPLFSEVSRSVDFIPASNSHSVSSTQVYNSTVGATSSSLGQASFSAMVDDGITDGLSQEDDQILVFKFFPNRNKAPYSLTQGILGLDLSYPADDQIKVSATISAEQKTVKFSS